MATKQWKDYNDTEKGIVWMLVLGAVLIVLGAYASFGVGAALMTAGFLIIVLACLIVGGKS